MLLVDCSERYLSTVNVDSVLCKELHILQIVHVIILHFVLLWV